MADSDAALQSDLESFMRQLQQGFAEASTGFASKPLPKLGERKGDRLEHGKLYLQIAFNYDLGMASSILPKIQVDDRILVEAGTPFIKRYGASGIKRIASLWPGKIVADIKTVDGAAAEVEECYFAGATAATVIGNASTETLDLFIETCERLGMDSMVDMLNVEKPLKVLMPLKKKPTVVVIHRGRDEETTRGKVIKYKHINKIRGKYGVFISAAGGVDLKEARSAVFNGAEIVVANIVRPGDPWKGISSAESVEEIALKFLETIG